MSRDYIVIDPVTDRFDYEVPFSKKHDSKMKVTMLNGIDGESCQPTKPRILLLKRFERVIDVERQGLVPTAVFLREHKIPFGEINNPENNAGIIQVITPNGLISIPTVITKEQSQIVLQQYNAPFIPASNSTCTPATQPPPPKENDKKFSWWWLAAGVVGLCFVTAEDESPQQKQSGVSALNGTKKSKHKAKRKPEVIHI